MTIWRNIYTDEMSWKEIMPNVLYYYYMSAIHVSHRLKHTSIHHFFYTNTMQKYKVCKKSDQTHHFLLLSLEYTHIHTFFDELNFYSEHNLSSFYALCFVFFVFIVISWFVSLRCLTYIKRPFDLKQEKVNNNKIKRNKKI